MQPRVEQVADGVAHVRGPGVAWQMLIDGEDVCLVDAGWPGDVELVTASLEQVGRTPADVSAVLLTHAHPDHIGAAEHLRAHHGSEVLAHREEAPHARGERVEQATVLALLARLWRPGMAGFVLNSLRHRALRAQRVTTVRGVEEGGALDVPGRPVPVATPGHTTGHCAFHLPDRGVVLTGDGLVTEDPISGREGPRMLPAVLHHDPVAALESLQRLRPLAADTLLPGHGAPFKGPADLAVTGALQQG